MTEQLTSSVGSVEALAKPPSHIVDLAVEVSGWSPCRSKRGVVIFAVNGDVIAHGYNYKPRGFDCDGTAACKATCRAEAIHAEQQALLAAERSVYGAEMLHVKTVGGKLVSSGGPSCVECSKLAIASAIAGFWLYHDDGWRRYEMDEFHRLSAHARQQEAAQTREAQWQPIASAPKDGTVIIGYDQSRDDDDGLPHGVDFMRWFDGTWIDPLTHSLKPSHWMPLPAPPSGAREVTE
jgi:deoxycytidylate deaminase